MSEPPSPASVPLPIYLAPRTDAGEQLTVKRRPGRPRKVEPRPLLGADERDYLAARGKALAEHVDADALVRAGREEHSGDVLQAVLIGLATEAASLKWEIAHALEKGREVAPIRSRRVEALSKCAAVLLSQRKTGIDRINPGGLAMAKVIGLFVQYVQDAFHVCLPAPQAADLTNQVRERLTAWVATAPPL